MARTIFGIFSLWLAEKQKVDAMVGREISTDLNGEELTILANQYNVNTFVVELAYKMWTVNKPTRDFINRICQKAMKLNNKERVFLYNSLVPIRNMVFENTSHNREMCGGNNTTQIVADGLELGLFAFHDEYFWNDKDFGFMSFNELRANELAFAIEDWFDVEK